jgi:hypothetical protein
MRNRLTLAALMAVLLCSLAHAQDKQCKIESTYDRFTDTTEDLCQIQSLGKLNILAVATYKGKKAVEMPRFSLVFSYFDKEATPREPLKYDKAATLFILADDDRRQVPLVDYKTSTGKFPLRGHVIHIEQLTAEMDGETLQRIAAAKRAELRLDDVEIELTDDARTLLRGFITRLEN